MTSTFFPEYVLPSIAPLVMDNSVAARIAYARNVGRLKKRIFPKKLNLFEIEKTKNFNVKMIELY